MEQYDAWFAWSREPGPNAATPGTVTRLRGLVDVDAGTHMEQVQVECTVAGSAVRDGGSEVFAAARAQMTEAVDRLLADEHPEWTRVDDLTFWYQTEDRRWTALSGASP